MLTWRIWKGFVKMKLFLFVCVKIFSEIFLLFLKHLSSHFLFVSDLRGLGCWGKDVATMGQLCWIFPTSTNTLEEVLRNVKKLFAKKLITTLRPMVKTMHTILFEISSDMVEIYEVLLSPCFFDVVFLKKKSLPKKYYAKQLENILQKHSNFFCMEAMYGEIFLPFFISTVNNERRERKINI